MSAETVTAWKQRLLSALTGIVFANFAWAMEPGPALQDYNHVIWTAKDGAPTGITAMAQTPDGWLWLGTPTGVYRFDGVRFYPLAARNGEKLLGNQVWALAAEPNGDLYIGYVHGGLSVLHADGRLEHLAPASKEGPVRWTYQVVRDIDGSVWVGTTAGLLHLEHGRWSKMGPEQGYTVQVTPLLALDSQRQLWAGNGERMFRYDRAARRFAAVDLPSPGNGEAPDAFEMTMAPDGGLWRTGNGQFTLVSAPAPAPAPAAAQAAAPAAQPDAPVKRQGNYYGIFDRSGNLWALRCPRGVCLAAAARPDAEGRIDVAAATTSRLDLPGQLSSPSPHVVLEDREGNIWIGTPTGIERLRRNALRPLPLPLTNTSTYRVVADADGSAWVVMARSHQGLHYDPARRRFTELPGKYYDAAQGPDGAVFLKEHSIRLQRAGIETEIALPPGAAEPEQGAWVRDDGRHVWLGVHGARGNGTLVQLWDGRAWKALADLEQDNLVFAASGEHGQMWVGLDDGRLLLFEGGRRRAEYDQAALGRIGVVQHVSTTPEFVVGGEHGVTVRHNGRFQRLPALREDVLRNVSGFYVGADGSRWINGAAGLLRVAEADWRRSVDGGAALRHELLDALEGYPGSSDPLRASLNLVNGRLWVNATGGVVELDPGRRERNLVQPQPALLGVTADGASYSLLQPPLVRAGTTRLRFDFTAPALRKPERIAFSYRLDGVDQDWQAGTERSATYTGLAPGDYRFRLRAMNEDGVWSEREVRLDLQVAPTLVQTIYFKLACALAVALLLWQGYRWRLRHVLHRLQQRFDDRTAERERIARDLHDTLLQSMQGLFLGFRRIASRTPETAPTRAMMEETLAVALEVLEEGRDKVGGLRGATGQREDLADIVRSYGERLAKQHGNAFSLVLVGVPRAVPAAVHDELQAITREALNNAFHHAQARHVEVRIAFEERELEVMVVDDGAGIPSASLGGKAGHWGIPGMRERARQLGAQLGVSTGEGTGTRWRLVVPARLAYGTMGQEKVVAGEAG